MDISVGSSKSPESEGQENMKTETNQLIDVTKLSIGELTALMDAANKVAKVKKSEIVAQRKLEQAKKRAEKAFGFKLSMDDKGIITIVIDTNGETKISSSGLSELLCSSAGNMPLENGYMLGLNLFKPREKEIVKKIKMEKKASSIDEKKVFTNTRTI